MRSLFFVLSTTLLCQISSAEEFTFKPPPNSLDARQEAYIQARYKPDVYRVYVGGMTVQLTRDMILKLHETQEFTEGALTLRSANETFSMPVASPQNRLEEIRNALERSEIYDVTLSTGEQYLFDRYDWQNIDHEKGVEYLGQVISQRQKTRYRAAIMAGVLLSLLMMGVGIIDLNGYAPIRLTSLMLVASCSFSFWEISKALETYDLQKIGFKGMLPFSLPIAMAILWSLLPAPKKKNVPEPGATAAPEESTEA